MKSSDQHLHLVLLSLQSCQSILNERRCDTANLVAIAILDLRMKLNGITDSELKALCEKILDDQSHQASEAITEGQRRPAPPTHPRDAHAMRTLSLAQNALKRHATA